MRSKYPVMNLGGFEAVPLSEEEVSERSSYTMVPWTQLAFGVYGPYFNPSMPEQGRFARLSGPWFPPVPRPLTTVPLAHFEGPFWGGRPWIPPYAALITPWGAAFGLRQEGWWG